MGPETIGFMGAPPDVVEGASQGTPLYYAMIIGIVGLLLALAWLAWRPNKGRIARWVLWLFAAIFSLRGALFLLFIPTILKADFGPEATKFWFHFGASLFVLSIGLTLSLGLWKTRKIRDEPSN